jgi:hypothetical protein
LEACGVGGQQVVVIVLARTPDAANEDCFDVLDRQLHLPNSVGFHAVHFHAIHSHDHRDDMGFESIRTLACVDVDMIADLDIFDGHRGIHLFKLCGRDNVHGDTGFLRAAWFRIYLHCNRAVRDFGDLSNDDLIVAMGESQSSEYKRSY